LGRTSRPTKGRARKLLLDLPSKSKAKVEIPTRQKHQVEIPQWTDEVSKSDSKWLGTRVWNVYIFHSKLDFSLFKRTLSKAFGKNVFCFIVIPNCNELDDSFLSLLHLSRYDSLVQCAWFSHENMVISNVHC
jgi:hypothetical protein